jgi:hypothetical protein
MFCAISSSGGELGPVFQAMLENATRLCEAKFGVLWRVDGETFYTAATQGLPPALAKYLERGPHRPGPKTGLGRLLKTRACIHVLDALEDRAYAERDPIRAAAVELGGVRNAEDVMALLRDYHAAIGEIIIKYNGTLERYAGDGVMVVFNDPVPVENPALQAVLMALEVRDAIGALTETWSRLGHEVGFGIGIAHGFATLGTIGFEGRFDSGHRHGVQRRLSAV